MQEARQRIQALKVNGERVIAFYYDNEGLYGYLYLNDGRIILLNETGVEILKHLHKSPMKLSDLLERISREYEVPQDRIRDSIFKFIEKLIAMGVIRYEEN